MLIHPLSYSRARALLAYNLRADCELYGPRDYASGELRFQDQTNCLQIYEDDKWKNFYQSESQYAQVMANFEVVCTSVAHQKGYLYGVPVEIVPKQIQNQLFSYTTYFC